MITDADIKKMKALFVTKEDLKQMSDKFENKFATKDDLKRFATKDEISLGFRELVKYIGETRIEIVGLLTKQINDFQEEFNDFRQEMRDINRNSQSNLNNHETRINYLEYINKI